MDLISRQAAIDAADKIIERDTSGNNDVVKAMTAWKTYVEGLPSVQPEKADTPTGIIDRPTNAPTDCISRQMAIDVTWQEPSYTDPLNVLTEVRDRIKALPSAQPEIIRCKECEYGVQDEGEG